jgi:2,4-dienoyl-CoA reductase-like NADH-dependent reductase (Old Yellow Enzyme family)
LSYPRIASLKTAAAFRAHLERSGIALGFDEQLTSPAASPLAQPIEAGGVRIGNRFCILPMEGWDGTREGEPSELTRRRWRHFGISGAKLIWGGEAVAVRHDGRANPNQLMLTRNTAHAMASLRDQLVASHRERFGSNADADLFIGLQLTHSGRFARPDAYDCPAPLAGAAHPLLDRRFPSGIRVLTDAELDRLIDDFVAAATLARDCGFQFVDVKACHGYLGHELLGARGRAGRYGGSLENRTRFMRQIIESIRANVPGLQIVVRLSAFDTVPYRKRPDGVGEPEDAMAVPKGCAAFGFGIVERDDDLDRSLEESRAVLRMLERLGVRCISVTGGSPYYNPHVQRPAMFPPLDGYEPPEDPLRGVARHIRATALLKQSFPGLVFVGSGYSYLQEWLPHVAQQVIRAGMADFVGLGRMVLAYPELPSDVLEGRPLRRASICRTFSDCTTGPRLGLMSGCFPLDKFYAARPEAIQVRDVRTRSAKSLARQDEDEPADRRASLSGERDPTGSASVSSEPDRAGRASLHDRRSLGEGGSGERGRT